MAKTFMQMAAEAQAEVPEISPTEAQRRAREDPRTLIVDVRDAADIAAGGRIPGSLAVSAGMLPVRADQELPEDWREAQLQDRDRPVITHCVLGPLGAMSAKTLKDMGFTNVSYIEGGIEAWKQAGLPVEGQ
jgi:rhodanese-related sulfurtransferase